MISKKRKKRVRVRKEKWLIDICIRYILMILLGIKNLWVFYAIFTPLTIYASAILLNLFFKIGIFENLIIVNNLPIEIIKACVAGSAYYLLLILNLTTRGIKTIIRIKILLFNFALLFVLNIIRIVLLVYLYVTNSASFDITHKIFWYGISTAYVVLIWLLSVKIWKIKAIPFYSDFRYLNSLRKK